MVDLVKINVKSFDETNHTLVVRFSAQEGTGYYETPDLAFQTYNFKSPKLDDIIKELGSLGKAYIEQEKQKQILLNDQELVSKLKELKDIEIETKDTNPPVPVSNENIIDNLEVVLWN